MIRADFVSALAAVPTAAVVAAIAALFVPVGEDLDEH